MFKFLRKLNIFKIVYRVEECNGQFRIFICDFFSSECVSTWNTLDEAKACIARAKTVNKKKIVYEE
jgi:hypothetical protein